LLAKKLAGVKIYRDAFDRSGNPPLLKNARFAASITRQHLGSSDYVTENVYGSEDETVPE
jgi:hypothetical protein